MALSTARWEFPLPHVHTSMLLGNATTGLMIWGQDNRLKITIGRADLWDHRGGMQWTAKQNYVDIAKHLVANDEPSLRSLFVTDTEKQIGQPERPSIIPVGRVDLLLADDVKLHEGTIDLATGIATIICIHHGVEKKISIQLSMQKQIAMIHFEDHAILEQCINQPAYVTTGNELKDISFMPPTEIKSENISGYIQPFPNDPGIAVGTQQQDNTLWLVTTRNQSVEQMLADTQAALKDAIAQGISKLEQENKTWWKNYWKDVPEIDIPNPKLKFLYDYGMYKFAGSSQPNGLACTLQGPWIEDHTLPPWSSDYHFNINVQMCYWPAFKGNRLSHLKPLFDLVFSWESILNENARLFLGIEDGLMLPHAVDDRCTCMGGFWTGCIDHACTAWVAMMMFDYVRYSGDMDYLQDKVYPFMIGTMRVYEEMLEKTDNGYNLPVSVSPEYRGANMNAWGANASFQLASIHRLLENLQAASTMLNVDANPLWQDIADHLPMASTSHVNAQKLIGLWDGVHLEESHRHHSHLGGISPFDTIDIDAKENKQMVYDTLDQWIKQGMGQWSGWCVPWASMIHSRIGNGQAAELLLEMWERVFTNKGYGSLHDVNFPGFSVMGGSTHPKHKKRVLMQLDGGFGAVAAISEMLLHSRRDILHVMPGVPETWKQCRFSPTPTEFGVLVSAQRAEYKLQQITLHATRDTTFKIANPWDTTLRITDQNDEKQNFTGSILSMQMKQNEQWELTSI